MKPVILSIALASMTVASAAFAAETARPSEALVNSYVEATFGKASPDWKARMILDETIADCNRHRSNVSAADAEKIQKRELAKVVFPTDGNVIGDWKAGYVVANEGRGGQFSDPPGTISGGNCYACHQLDPKEVSYGTLGPSLTGYGKLREFKVADAKATFLKIFDSQAVLACSNMPRFGTNKVLTEKQIKDLVAYLFDPESPVNK